MPSAGAVVPPSITPLRKASPDRCSSKIFSDTYIEVCTESADCKLYFTTDGAKPNPFQLRIAGREVTFRYRGAFTLKPGKRTVKAIAVSRDGLKESNVVTKSFTVADVCEADDDGLLSGEDTFKSVKTKSFKPKRSATPPPPKEAWATSRSTTFNSGASVNGVPDPGVTTNHENHVQLPDGPFNPTNYSGTQVNFWGVSPSGGVAPGGASNPLIYPDRPAQLGFLTNNMLRDVNQQRMTVGDLRTLMEMMQNRPSQQAPPPPPIEQPINKDPEAMDESPGDGDWHGNMEHIYAHLLDRCKNNSGFRNSCSMAIMGKIHKASFDEEEDAVSVKITFLKPGHPPPRPKPIVQKPPPQPAAPKPVVQKPAPVVQKPKPVAKPPPPPKKEAAPPPKPKPAAKAKPPPEPKKKDPYFETEEYETPTSPELRKNNIKPIVKHEEAVDVSSRNSHIREDIIIASSEIKDNDDDDVMISPAARDKKKATVPTQYLKKVDNNYLIKSKMQHVDDAEVDVYHHTEEYEQEATLKPWPTFDPEYDCEKLRKAMKGMGTDEAAIIDVMGYRTSPQRQELMKMFKTMFGKDLRKELDGELSGDFGDLVDALTFPPDEYDATQIRRAVQGLGTDEDCLIEILCTRTNVQIRAINDAYKKLFDKDMEKDVKDDTSGYFQKLLVSQIQGNRNEDPKFDRTLAEEDAKRLYEAGEKKWGTDESVFNRILVQRSFAHLRAVFEEYKKISKKNIVEAIKSEFSGDIKDFLVTLVRVIQDKPGYFALKMQKAMKGLGTDDKALIRVVVSRCECDMVQIKAAFQRDFEKPLSDWIKDDTGGDYMELLLALIGDRIAPEPSREEKESAEMMAGEPELEEMEEVNDKNDPTVVPMQPFDPGKDAEILRKAMKGLGTDENSIIDCLAKRTNDQRQEISKQFRTKFGKDLVKELKSELSGNLWETIKAMMKEKAEYDAYELKRAMKGLGTDEDALIEILCTRENEEMKAIIEVYKQLYQKSLEEDIIGDTSGHLKRILVSLVQASRPVGNTIDRRKARKDAKDLFEAGEKSWGTDESRFNVVLCSRSYAHLRATFDEYQKLTKKDIEESIKSEMSGDIKNAMLTIVKVVRNRAGHFAHMLYKSMKGLGTDDETLIRIVVSRSEVDMVQIKENFQTMQQQSLGQFVKDDLSGDYRRTILRLIAEDSLIKK